jgi:hypothetical protein
MRELVEKIKRGLPLSSLLQEQGLSLSALVASLTPQETRELRQALDIGERAKKRRALEEALSGGASLALYSLALGETPEELLASLTRKGETPEELLASLTRKGETPEELLQEILRKGESPEELLASLAPKEPREGE